MIGIQTPVYVLYFHSTQNTVRAKKVNSRKISKEYENPHRISPILRHSKTFPQSKRHEGPQSALFQKVETHKIADGLPSPDDGLQDGDFVLLILCYVPFFCGSGVPFIRVTFVYSQQGVWPREIRTDGEHRVYELEFRSVKPELLQQHIHICMYVYVCMQFSDISEEKSF